MTSVQADGRREVGDVRGLEAFDAVLAVVEGTSGAIGSGGGTGAAAAGARLESWLAPDVRTWIASPEQGLRAEVELASGPRASADALARLAPSRLAVVGAVGSATACWAEIIRHGDAEPETCLAGLTYDPEGGVSRLVWLRAPLVPFGEVDVDAGIPDARPILEGYFADLMTSRFREAAARFSADTLYSHPPYGGGSARVLFQGRDALVRGFETERGPSPARQIITGLWQQSGQVFVEGVIAGIPDGGTFFSAASITRAGEIARYVAFYCATRIPRRHG